MTTTTQAAIDALREHGMYVFAEVIAEAAACYSPEQLAAVAGDINMRLYRIGDCQPAIDALSAVIREVYK